MATCKKPRESDLVAQCLAWLALRRILAWRNNSGALRAGKRYVRFGCPGSPDILAILRPTGRLLCIECKSARGRLSAAQRTWLAAAEDAGAKVLVVRGLDDLVQGLSDG